MFKGFNQGNSTPPSERADDPSPDFLSQPQDDSPDELHDEDQPPQSKVEPKKGGYDSRIEQILYEHPDLEIHIVHAGKNTEGGGSYITYTIRTGVSDTCLP